MPDFVVDSPRVFEGGWGRPATPSTVRRALHAALRTTLRTAARRNFCFFVPVGFFRGAAFRPGASSVAFSWSLSPCRLSRGLACRSLCAFSGLGVVGSLFSRRVTCAALKYFCWACGRRKFFLSCLKPTSFSVRPQNLRGTVGVRAHTSPKCSARSLLFYFFRVFQQTREVAFSIFFSFRR